MRIIFFFGCWFEESLFLSALGGAGTWLADSDEGMAASAIVIA